VAFKEIDMAWTKTTTNDYCVATTTAAVTMANTPIYSDRIDDDLSSSWGALLGIIVVSAGTEAVSTLDLQGSYDGTTYFKLGSSVIADLVTGSTGANQACFDTTIYRCPYYRLVFNANSATVGTSGTFKFLYATCPAGAAFARTRC
jgi:hypothetical protein